jgi:hypothetical protein
MAGFTGADCMGLMQRAARMAARQVGRFSYTRSCSLTCPCQLHKLQAKPEHLEQTRPAKPDGRRIHSNRILEVDPVTATPVKMSLVSTSMSLLPSPSFPPNAGP